MSDDAPDNSNQVTAVKCQLSVAHHDSNGDVRTITLNIEGAGRCTMSDLGTYMCARIDRAVAGLSPAAKDLEAARTEADSLRAQVIELQAAQTATVAHAQAMIKQHPAQPPRPVAASIPPAKPTKRN